MFQFRKIRQWVSLLWGFLFLSSIWLLTLAECQPRRTLAYLPCGYDRITLKSTTLLPLNFQLLVGVIIYSDLSLFLFSLSCGFPETIRFSQISEISFFLSFFCQSIHVAWNGWRLNHVMSVRWWRLMVVMFGFTSALAEWTGTTVYHSDGVMAIIDKSVEVEN